MVATVATVALPLLWLCEEFRCQADGQRMSAVELDMDRMGHLEVGIQVWTKGLKVGL